MNDTAPAPLDLRALPGYFVPDAMAEPRPPYQLRGMTELFLSGPMPPDLAARLLPRGMKMTPGSLFCMAVFDAPEGWGPMPYRQFLFSFEVEGYNSVDGRPADYLAAGTVSGRAGEIFARDYNAHLHRGDIDFAVVDGSITASAPLEGGDGRISFFARRGTEPPGRDAGVASWIGPDGADGLTIYSVGYSLTFTSVSDIQIKVDLPPGHRLEFLRDLRPDWGVFMWDKAASISAPQPLAEAYGDASSRMAFLDTLSRLGRAVAIVEQTGRLAFLTREAEALLKDDHGPALTRLPAAVSRTVLASPLDSLRQPALITLASGRQLAARAFPIALRLGSGPLSMVLLTDPRAPGPTDPEPLLRLMGLTPSEAALATLIGQGHPPAHAARTRGITQTTARSMLKLIYPKLGVSRQAKLAILVTRLQSS